MRVFPKKRNCIFCVSSVVVTVLAQINVNTSFFSSTSPRSGISPTPQHPRPGPLTPSPHYVALPVASSPPSGSGPPPAYHHYCPSSLRHRHSGAGRRAHSPHGSRLHERTGIAGPHGNNSSVVTCERSSSLPSNQNTHPVSLFLPSVFLCVFLFIWPSGDRQTAALVQAQRSACSGYGWGSVCGAMKDEWIWRMEDGCRLVSPTCLLLPDCLRARLVYAEEELYSLVCSLFALLQLQQDRELS